MAYDVVYRLSQGIEAMATHLVATLMLQYRQGVTRVQLLNKVDWLRQEIVARGGRVAGFEMEFREQVLDRALQHLSAVVCVLSFIE